MDAASKGDLSGAARLAALGPRYPQIADYIAYWRARALAQARRYDDAAAALDPVFNPRYPSPLAGRAAVVGARSLIEAGRFEAAAAMLSRLPEGAVPEPQGSFLAARAAVGLGQYARAATLYQRVYYEYPLSPEAAEAGAALNGLARQPDLDLPGASSEAKLGRARRLAGGGRTSDARSELLALAGSSSGVIRDLARIRAAASLYAKRQTREALSSLLAVRSTDAEAEAERLYYVLLCHRRLDDVEAMLGALQAARQAAPSSAWTLRSIVAAANSGLVRNEPASYVPLFRACATQFAGAPEAASCHWKVAWRAYLDNAADARVLLEEHLLRFPGSEKAGAALYFLGRLEEARNNVTEAGIYYGELRSRFPNYYYSFVAAARPLSGVAGANGGAASRARKLLQSVRWPDRNRNAGFHPDAATSWSIERARLLARLGLGTWAELELRFAALNGAMRYPLAIELAVIASQRGAAGTALRHIKGVVPDYLWLARDAAPRRFWELAYPFPYRREIEREARKRGLDPFLVAALIRQESEFDPEAVSPSGAVGLMQVMPASGRQLGRRVGLRGVTERSLKRPKVNLPIGTYYLAHQLEAHQGSVEAALAAYNAGPTRVPVWLGWAKFREPSEFVETIPLSQTRDYVQVVVRNWHIYRWLYAGAAARNVPAASSSRERKKGASRGRKR